MHIMGKNIYSKKDAIALGDKIRNARIEKDMTLKSLGKIIGVDHSQISRYERGQVVRISKNLQKICTFLQIDDDLDRFSVGGVSLGRRVDELLLLAPEGGPAVAKLVEALEELLTAANLAGSDRGVKRPAK